MKSKYFSINSSGYSIRCKLYGTDAREYGRIVIFGHGFGGHKDNRAAEKFAGKLLGKEKDVAVVTFDWPGHGEDAMRELHLADCDRYLDLVVHYLRENFSAKTLYAYATSFGGYLFLKYIHDHENPFNAIALRCPAVKMYEVFGRILTEEDRKLLTKGKPAIVGFDRKVRVSQDYLNSIQENDITAYDYSIYSDRILILTGTKDELVPCEMVTAFADRNDLCCMTIEGADHRFQNPLKMDEAIKEIIAFFDMSEGTV